MERWVKKVAVVTGASSGIGESIVKSLIVAGMNVIGVARREDLLKKLSDNLKGSKGSFHYMRCDLRNEDDILNAFDNIEKKFGGVDVLVNNAGILLNDTIREGKTETFRAILEVNVLGPTICCREAMKSMRKRKTEGHIINMNSVLGLKVSTRNPLSNLYAASKFALTAMNDTLKGEIIATKDNIRVTSIHPGLVKTEIFNNTGLEESIFKTMPYIESKDIADCVVFALSAPPKTEINQIVVSPLHQVV